MIDTTLRNTVPHDPPNSYGNCQSVCVAAIMGLSVDDVPHFYERGDAAPADEGKSRFDAFLAERQWRVFTIIFPADHWRDVASTLGLLSPGIPAILGGKSRRGCGHSVVIMDGDIILDPTGSGIVGPLDENGYWVQVLMPAPRHWTTANGEATS